MKIKNDFITNSSSASFMIPRSCLTDKQVEMIINHIELAAIMVDRYKYKSGLYLDPWAIDVDDHSVNGNTSMDNFDMLWFLEDIVKVDRNNIHMGGSNYYENEN